MKSSWFMGASFPVRRLAWASAGVLLATSSAAWSATEVRVWHSLNGHNLQVFEALVKSYNRSQDQVQVRLKGFDNEDAVEAALVAAKGVQDRPHLVQLDDDRYPEAVSRRPYMQPLHQLLEKNPIKDAKWFVSEQVSFARDGRGRLLAFPYMLEIPVMYYNIDAFKKANLNPPAPDRVWTGLQGQLVSLANNGSRQCPLTSDQSVSVNLENLAAVNNQLFINEPTGKGKNAKPAEFSFDSLYIRHLSMMISWVKSEIMVKPGGEAVAAKRFANKECAVLISASSNLGWFKEARGLDFSLTGLPYYPEVTKTPGNPFVGGSAIWATSGHPKETDAAMAGFLAWLAKPDNAANWFQRTGYLPLTQQAFAATPASYYKGMGNWQEQVSAYARNPAANGRGFRIDNYPRIRAMFHQTLETALNGNQPAVTALKMAADEAGKLMQQRAR
ncbi:MAG: extracellular solute-binding protein [Alcaligenaceae bacterium]|nr:extracellular solute-binding protein [Alcaligenaceae bacterium]